MKPEDKLFEFLSEVGLWSSFEPRHSCPFCGGSVETEGKVKGSYYHLYFNGEIDSCEKDDGDAIFSTVFCDEKKCFDIECDGEFAPEYFSSGKITLQGYSSELTKEMWLDHKNTP